MKNWLKKKWKEKQRPIITDNEIKIDATTFFSCITCDKYLVSDRGQFTCRWRQARLDDRYVFEFIPFWCPRKPELKKSMVPFAEYGEPKIMIVP